MASAICDKGYCVRFGRRMGAKTLGAHATANSGKLCVDKIGLDVNTVALVAVEVRKRIWQFLKAKVRILHLKQ